MVEMTYSEAGRQALREAMQRDRGVWALGQDISRGGVFGQYRGLAEEFGVHRIVDAPIAEASILGAAIGAALVGTRPVVETRFSDFALSAMDELVNQAAKNRYMFGGQGRVPVVIRMPSGPWSNSAAQHSQSLEAWFAHIPGLVVTAPATPADERGLLLAALRGDDPVVHMESKALWTLTSDVPDSQGAIQLGTGRIIRAGRDVTIVAWSSAVHQASHAADMLAEAGVSTEIIDLRTIWPWDRDLVLDSAARTRRLVITHESVRDAGFGAEVAATAAEELHGSLAAPVRRVASPRIPIGYSPTLEDVYRVTAQRIAVITAALVGAELLASATADKVDRATKTIF